MANPSWFSSEYYLFSKQAELAAQGVTITIPELEAAISADGYTPFTHYEAFSTAELTDPNEYFSTQQVIQAQADAIGKTFAEVQAAFEANGFTNAYSWWAEFGWTNGINPSNDFNDEAYLEAKAMASGLTVAEVQAAFEAADLTPLQHYLEFGQAEGLEATPVYLDEQVAWQYSTALGTTAGQAVVGSEVSEQFTAVASPLSRSNTLHATDTIDGLGGINTLTVDLAQNFAGFSTGKGLTNIQNVQLINADAGIARTYTGTGSAGVENYALAGDVNLASLTSVANVVAQDRTQGLSITYTTAATAGTQDQLNLTTIDVANADAAVTVTAAGIETLQLDTHGVNILNLSGVANATELVVLGDGVTEIEAVGAAVKAVDAGYASGDLTINLSGATGVTSVVTGTGENHIVADVNIGELSKVAVIEGNGEVYNELLLTNVGGTGIKTVQYTMSGVESLALGANASTIQFSAKNTTGLEAVEVQAAFSNTGQVVNLGAVDMVVDLQANSGGTVTLDNSGATLVATDASTAATTAATETNTTAVTLTNSTALDVFADLNTTLTGTVTASKATSVDVEIDGAINATISAGAATGVTLVQENSKVSSTINLQVAAATSLEVVSAGTLALTSSDLSGLQTLNVDTDGKFTGVAMAAANSVTFAGEGDVVNTGAIGSTSNSYGLTVDASGLEGDLNLGDLNAGAGYNLALNLASLGGANGTVGNITATTGTVTIDAVESMAALKIGTIAAKTVTVDATDVLNTFDTGVISASSKVTYLGNNEGTTADISATGSTLTVAYTGGLNNDKIDIDVANGVGTKSITVTGSMDLGTDVIDISASASTVASAINFSAVTGYETATVAGSSLNDTITAGSGADSIAGGAGADSIVSGSGADNILGEAGADTVSAGYGADTIGGGDGNDVIYLGATDTNADIYNLIGTAITSATVNVDTVNNFEVGYDKIGFGSTFMNGETFMTSTNTVTGAASAFTSANIDDIYIATTGSAADKTAVLALVSAAFSGSAVADDAAVYIINDGNGVANIYYLDESLDGTNALTVNDIVLVGVLDVSAANLTSANIGALV